MNRSTEPDFDQRIADWLEGDPNLAPRQAIETVMAAYPSIPQRRRIGLPRRFPIMTMPIRIGADIASASDFQRRRWRVWQCPLRDHRSRCRDRRRAVRQQY